MKLLKLIVGNLFDRFFILGLSKKPLRAIPKALAVPKMAHGPPLGHLWPVLINI
jgi:hypothetical protein